MRKLFSGEIALGFVLGVFALLSLIGVASYQVEHCSNVNAHAGSALLQEESSYDHGNPIACGIVGFIPSVVQYMDHNEGFFVGIFTFALFTATFRLWRSTHLLWKSGEQQIAIARNSAEAANKSANALRDIERAYVFIDYDLLERRNRSMQATAPTPYVQIEVTFKNFGRTPAIVNGLNIKCYHWPNLHLPILQANTTNFPKGIVIGSDRWWSIPITFIGTQQDVDNAMAGFGSIYLHGEIAYVDMLGEQRTAGFCCEWTFGLGQFVLSPIEGLNYHT